MILRKILLFVLIVYFQKSIKNAFLEDTRIYNVNKFTLTEMMDIQYRCIRYFEDSRKNKNLFSSYHENACNDYKYDYLNFILAREKVYFNNFVKKIVLITVTYITLYFA